MTNEENNKIDYPPNYLRSEVGLPPITNKESEEQIMAITKYIIDKSDIAALLRGEELAIQPRGNIRGFCVEIAGDVTNGDMVKAMFPNASETDHFILNSPIGNIVYIRLEGYQEMRVQQEWWNAPYNGESEEEND